MLGNDCGAPRPPAAWPLSQSQSDRLRGFMNDQNLLKNG
jgi:4-hydroxy-tetrahydrodipicolinate synthase